MEAKNHPIGQVSVITTGSGGAHPEHMYGTRKPQMWWVLTSKRWVEIPINVFVIEHVDGLVLFDTGMDPRVATDPGYWPDRITRFFMGRIFRFDIGPDDALGRQLALAGYRASDVKRAVLSHLHFDHAGGIAEIPEAELFVAPEAWDHMMGPHPEREAVLRGELDVAEAKWRQMSFEPTDDPALSVFGEAFDLMGDGSLMVVPTPGHLDGSVSMLIRRADAPPLLLIGDLTYSQELLERDKVAGTGDKKLLRESFAKVRALQQHIPDLVVVAAHDTSAAGKIAAGTPRAIRAEA